MWRELWDAFCDWASDAWNWVKNFFKRIWKEISSWWDALVNDIQELIEAILEVFVVDTSTPNGEKLRTELARLCPEATNFNGYKQKMMFGFDKSTHELKKVADYEAKTVNDTNTGFDRDLAKKGIIRFD